MEAVGKSATDAEIDIPARADRAEQLAAAIAREYGLDPERCLEQVDEQWP